LYLVPSTYIVPIKLSTTSLSATEQQENIPLTDLGNIQKIRETLSRII